MPNLPLLFQQHFSAYYHSERSLFDLLNEQVDYVTNAYKAQ
ncbi:hypothetical protein [Oscillatoria sp. FACHB-1407]|nr:hypothetical protein [Oscillatoria sp. FACHB-1407]